MRLGVALALFCLSANAIARPTQQHVGFEHAVVTEPDAAGAPQVTTAELREMITGGEAVLLDARSAEEFSVSHIPGALNVSQKPGTPMSFYVSDAAEVRRLVPDLGRPLVVYCNGPFCGKSRRLAEELLDAGYRSVRRYQLGIPGWRTAGGVAVIEASAVRRLADLDGTAVFVNAGLPAESRPLPHMVRLDPSEIVRAKDDGRLPMHDHNTRVIVLGSTGAQARAVAEAIAANAFHNVAFYDADASTLSKVPR